MLTSQVIENDPSSARLAFVQYVEFTLNSIISIGKLLKQDCIVHINEFRLRSLIKQSSTPVFISINNSNISLTQLLAQHVQKLLEITTPESMLGAVEKAVWLADLKDVVARGDLCVPPRTDDDYVFSYPVPDTPRPRNFAEYCARTIELLLDVVDLLSEDRVITPDQIIIGQDCVEIRPAPPYEPHTLGSRKDGNEGTGTRQPLHSIIGTEPIIAALARHWGLLASFLQLEINHTPVTIDGFQLRRTSDWVVPSPCHPSEVYEYLARVCNVACKFCYLYGNPSGIAVARGTKVVSRNEIETRLHYYNPAKKQALFHAQWEINEFLVDPKLPEVLRQLREYTDQPFFFITNGSPLTPSVIDLLAEVKPVHLIVSTNSLDAPLRSAVMREKEAQTRTALSCLQQLVACEIPFGVSLVAFPEIPFEGLAETIRTLNKLRPAFVRVNLPGFTRDHPYQCEFDTNKYWRSVVEWIQPLRDEVEIPLLTIPSAFEENFFHDAPNAIRVVGVVPNSPAAASGIKAGDIVRRIGFFEVESRAQLQSILLLSRSSIDLEVERNGAKFTYRIDPNCATRFPYTGHVIGKYIFPHGVVLSPSLSTGDAAAIKSAFETLDAHKGWLITSELMLPAIRDILQKKLPDISDRIHYVIAKNDFLGGNIRVLDMCTIGDIARAIDRELQVSPTPDVILLPATGFNTHGRDLAGRHWSDLERWFEIPVWLLTQTSQFAF